MGLFKKKKNQEEAVKEQVEERDAVLIIYTCRREAGDIAEITKKLYIKH